LAAAFRPRQAAWRVQVRELNDRAGGRMKTLRRNGFVIEEATRWYLV
jgi:monoamine oxidase